jgi:hypothetical protein
MVHELKKIVEAFAGEASMTRCFLHIINLTARTTIRLFDAPKKKDSSSDDTSASTDTTLDEACCELEKLAEDLELEDTEARAQYAQEQAEHDNDECNQDNLENSKEGWVDEREALSDTERKELDEGVLPVHLAIVKVHINFAPFCSSDSQDL